MMKGQLSMEYLMLFFVTLILLSISAFALLEIKSYSEILSKKIAFKYSAVSLGNAINEICVLGNGNSRFVLIYEEILVETEEDVLILTSADASYKKQIFCETENTEISKGGVYVENENGIIEIREQ